ncbi:MULTISPECIES: hypothetical protein [Streptomyces]|uniref:Lipoprotein n=1 Tax=Streptomyces lienomycini TaxID=284035 RepID=A0ABV9X4T1_9ACTN|nr:hypothetical protein [Streptomyces sp. NBC_00334]
MHRTATTATLLVTVAVSALAGCTTVRGPGVADPSAAGPRSSAPRPDGPVDPRAVQAPAREALEMIGPSPSSSTDRATGESRRPKPSTTAPAPPARAPEQRAARPAAPDRAPAPSRSKAPDPPRTSGGDAGKNADVCSLGKRYGGWRPGSPEAQICDQAYGH